MSLDIGSILGVFFLTIILYVGLPLLFCTIIKVIWKKRPYKTVLALNALAVLFLIFYIREITGDTSPHNAAPALFWSFISYWIIVKIHGKPIKKGKSDQEIATRSENTKSYGLKDVKLDILKAIKRVVYRENSFSSYSADIIVEISAKRLKEVPINIQYATETELLFQAYATLSDAIFRGLASGKYHIEAGKLNSIGEEMLTMYDRCLGFSKENGKLSEEEYEQSKQVVYGAIKNVG